MECSNSIVEELINQGYAEVECGLDFLFLFEQLEKLSPQLFSLDESSLKRALSAVLFNGYRPQGIEYSIDPDRPDLMNSISLSYHTIQNIKNYTHSFERIFLLLAKELFALAHRISSELARHYLVEDSTRYCGLETSFFQVSNYQPKNHLRESLQELHQDGNLFTLVMGSQPGLELLRPDGDYLPIDFKPKKMLVIPNEILSLLTGNQIKTCFHRVKNHTEQGHRVSAMCFVNPCIIKPISPWVTNSFNKGVDIQNRIQVHSTEFGLEPIV